MEKRKTDASDGSSRFRASSRIFRLNNEWYFSAREGDLGPFSSEDHAQKELDKFVKQIDPPKPDTIEITIDKPKHDPRIWDQFDLLN